MENGTDLASGNFTKFLAATKSTMATENQDYEKIFNDWEGILLTFVLVLLCILGLVANAVIFLTILTSKTLRRSPFNILLMSLCVSDFLSALNSPLQMYRRIWGFLDFQLPVGVCKLTVGLSQWTLFVTVQHILVFSVFRILAIKFPRLVKKFSAKGAIITALIMWIEVLVVVVIFYLMASTVVPYKPGRMKTSCTAVAKSWRPVAQEYTAYVIPILLFVPFVIVVVCAIGIVVALIHMKRKRGPQQKILGQIYDHETYVLAQVILIVFSFLLGYSLDAAYRMTKALDMRDIFTVRTKWLTLVTAYVLLRISECLNPLFYTLSSSQIRQKAKKLLRIKSKNPVPDDSEATVSNDDEKPTKAESSL